ncbi:monomeric isocitrate dehydrogenase [Fragilaria crotonensis]|nr:monomeric isocitrate dehydrogenase [Fragilaria crotonensis]
MSLRLIRSAAVASRFTTRPTCFATRPIRFVSSAFNIYIPPPPTSHHHHTPLKSAQGSIIYTETDEAPALATYSLLPVISKFGAKAGLDIIPCDISVAGRVLPPFRTSVPQLIECISELRSKGYDVPLYPAEPQNDAEREIQKIYSTILGSAVNPVLREGNSDRRVAAPVKAYAQKNPHRMGMWSKAARTHVAHMTHGDFYESELSAIMPEATEVAIEFTPTSSGTSVMMRDSIPLEKGEVIDAAFISVKALCL